MYYCNLNKSINYHNSDIDECTINNGGCDHNCTNINGSYYCNCSTGFLLDDDHHGCSGLRSIILLFMHFDVK